MSDETEVGHVAPYFESEFKGNTLAARPATYRISLRLGSAERLFAHSIEVAEGRMERLQVLGLFYFPLGHRCAREALEGKTISFARGLSHHFKGCWDWVKEKVFHANTLDEMHERIEAALREQIVTVGEPPLQGADAGRLPAEGEFAKIRLPGGYAFASINGATVNDNLDSNYDLDFHASRFDVEDSFYRDNPALGKIPLIANVEQWNPDSTQWEPAPEVTVYFQLRPPEPLPAPDTSPITRPALLSGIEAVVNRYEDTDVHPDNPQGRNCHTRWGGKRVSGNPLDGSDVANLFCTEPTPGFNVGNPARTIDMGQEPWVYFPTAEPVTDPSKPHSVKARTNAEGEAGVVFLPSRMGGDTYRVRAFVEDRPDRTGEEDDAVRVDTGTLAVWRNIRLSRFVRQDFRRSEGLWDLLETEMSNSRNTASYDTRYFCIDTGVAWDDGTDVRFLGLSDFIPEKLAAKFARAFCELEFDDGADAASSITDEEYAACHRLALEDGDLAQADRGTDYDLESLLFDWTAPGFSGLNTGCWTIMHTPEVYNQNSSNDQFSVDSNGDMDHPDEKTEIHRLCSTAIDVAFLRVLSHNGYLPGLTVLHSAAKSTWDAWDLIDGVAGRAEPYRGLFLATGAAHFLSTADPCHDAMSTLAHEAGHCLFRRHAPDHAPNMSEPGGAEDDEHDDSGDTGNICVMSYAAPTEYFVELQAEFCGVCLLDLRGWDVP